MNIKSLLLGSAAAFVAVTGARAADAVVMVEPEPMEYVRVCDVYGTGFFYIPGTETCLKIGGYVRMRINASDNTTNTDVDLDNLNSGSGLNGTITDVNGNTFVVNNTQFSDNVGNDFVRGFSGDDYNVFTRVRARLDIDAREETELGTLRAFARIQSTNNGLFDNNSNGQTLSSSFVMDSAFIQLGGLTMGKLDSLWAERDGLFTDNDWSVGDFNNNRVSYTFAIAGFTAAISAEDDGSGDFVPDVVGQLAYSGGFGEAYISGVYDEQDGNTVNGATFQTSATTFTNVAFPNYAALAIVDVDPTAAFLPQYAFVYNGDLNDNDDGAFALKAGVTLKDLIAPGGQLKVEGHYAFDPTVYTGDSGGYLAPNGLGTDSIFQSATTGLFSIIDTNTRQAYNLSSEYQIGAGYQQTFDKLFVAVSGVYGETFDVKRSVQSFTAAGVPNGIQTVNLGSAEYYGVAGDVGYNLTSNFSVLGEVSYREIDVPGLSGDDDTTAGFVEFKRSF